MAMRGFTLLEMLVVLVILGMAAGLIAPSLSRTAERVREAGDRDDVRRLLHALPILVRAQGVPLRLGPRILRTETAAVALLAVMQALWGDF